VAFAFNLGNQRGEAKTFLSHVFQETNVPAAVEPKVPPSFRNLVKGDMGYVGAAFACPVGGGFGCCRVFQSTVLI
jgi:hypothetical protein